MSNKNANPWTSCSTCGRDMQWHGGSHLCTTCRLRREITILREKVPPPEEKPDLATSPFQHFIDAARSMRRLQEEVNKMPNLFASHTKHTQPFTAADLREAVEQMEHDPPVDITQGLSDAIGRIGTNAPWQETGMTGNIFRADMAAMARKIDKQGASIDAFIRTDLELGCRQAGDRRAIGEYIRSEEEKEAEARQHDNDTAYGAAWSRAVVATLSYGLTPEQVAGLEYAAPGGPDALEGKARLEAMRRTRDILTGQPEASALLPPGELPTELSETRPPPGNPWGEDSEDD